MKKIRDDIFGNKPNIGDTIVYNPSYYKGLKQGVVVGFAKSGLPRVSEVGDIKNSLTPKTGFAIIKF